MINTRYQILSPYVLIEAILTLERYHFSGVFLELFKVPKNIPIYIKGGKKYVSNYRPTAILLEFSKIFEKLLSLKLISYLIKYKIVSFNQFGYQRGQSTKDAIVKIIDFTVEGLDKHKKAISVFLALQSLRLRPYC